MHAYLDSRGTKGLTILLHFIKMFKKNDGKTNKKETPSSLKYPLAAEGVLWPARAEADRTAKSAPEAPGAPQGKIKFQDC